MKRRELARFPNRWTIEYVRDLPHPIHRVWRAITEPAEFAQWFAPARIDLRVGGAYAFGGDDNPYIMGAITALDPPRYVRFGGDGRDGPGRENGWLEFALSETAGGTRMAFRQYFPPGLDYGEPSNELGGDLPAGPGSPWRPGFVSGWHEAFDAIADTLDGVPAGSRLPATELRGIAIAWVRQRVREGEIDEARAETYVLGLRRQEEWNELNKLYSVHIRDACPRA